MLEKMEKQKILIVDDSEMNRAILADILGEEYEIFEAEDGVKALIILQKHAMELSAVLLDIVMPNMNGFEVLEVMKQKNWVDDIPVIMISAETMPKQVEKAYELGATDFIMRPFDALIVHRRVVNTILLYTKQKRLLNLVADQIDEKERRSSVMVHILSSIVGSRNGESSLHIIHVRTLTTMLLRALQKLTDRFPMTESDISLISTASALHDIGKMTVDEKILNKPGRLTDEEFEEMKKHSLAGAQMLDDLQMFQDEPLLKTAYEICRWHHERYDGRGYPDGLKGDEIPISAQVVALADVYDALTSDRCYKKAFSHEEAVDMILNGKCGTFNPLLMECLRQSADSLEAELAGAQTSEASLSWSSLTRELLHGANLETSERSLYLLEKERIKFNFFSEVTEEIQFEYTTVPSMLNLSAWGAKRLGIDEVIMDPFHNEKALAVMEKSDGEELEGLLRNTTMEDPVVEYQCRFRLPEGERPYRIIARAIWSDENIPQYAGAIGRASEIPNKAGPEKKAG